MYTLLGTTAFQIIYIWSWWNCVRSKAVRLTTCFWRGEQQITASTGVSILQKTSIKPFEIFSISCMDIRCFDNTINAINSEP